MTQTTTPPSSTQPEIPPSGDLLKLICRLEGEVPGDGEDRESQALAKITSGFDYVYDVILRFQTDVALIIGGVIPKEGRDRQIGIFEISEPVIESSGRRFTVTLSGSLKIYFNGEEILRKVRSSGADGLAAVESSLRLLAGKLGQASFQMTEACVSVVDDRDEKLKGDRILVFDPVQPKSVILNDMMLAAFAGR
jgi:hypothetical protein